MQHAMPGSGCCSANVVSGDCTVNDVPGEVRVVAEIVL